MVAGVYTIWRQETIDKNLSVFVILPKHTRLEIKQQLQR